MKNIEFKWIEKRPGEELCRARLPNSTFRAMEIGSISRLPAGKYIATSLKGITPPQTKKAAQDYVESAFVKFVEEVSAA